MRGTVSAWTPPAALVAPADADAAVSVTPATPRRSKPCFNGIVLKSRWFTNWFEKPPEPFHWCAIAFKTAPASLLSARGAVFLRHVW